VSCARDTALRALRVSTGPDDSESVYPTPQWPGPERLTGGELTFAVPTAILVTLNF
jgi:hypothetical protein